MTDDIEANKMLDFVLAFQTAGKELSQRIRVAFNQNHRAILKTRNRKMSKRHARRVIDIAERLVSKDVERQIMSYVVDEARRKYKRYGLDGQRALHDFMQRDNFLDRIGKIIRSATMHSSQEELASRKMKRALYRVRKDEITNDLGDNRMLEPTHLDINLYNRARIHSTAVVQSVIKALEPV